MLKVELVDLSQNFVDHISNKIEETSKTKRVIFISANRRLIRFVERKLSTASILNTAFYTVEDFMQELALKFHTFRQIHSKLERELFFLNLLKNEFKWLYDSLGGDDLKVFSWAKRISSLFNEFDKYMLGNKLKNYQYMEEIEQVKNLLENLKDLYTSYEINYKDIGYNGIFFKTAAQIDELKLGELFKDCIFIVGGVVFLTESERRLFKKLPETHFILQTDLKKRENVENQCNNCNFETFKAVDRVVKDLKGNIEHIIKDNTKKLPNIELLEFSNIHEETLTIGQKITEIAKKKKDLRNPNKLAVILPDSSALFPLLNSLDNKLPINITMGYPFLNTDFGLFIINLFKLLLDIEVRSQIQKNLICSANLLLQVLNSKIMDLLDLNREVEKIKQKLKLNQKSTFELNELNTFFCNILKPFISSKSFQDFYESFVHLFEQFDKKELQREENAFLFEVILLFYREFVDSLKRIKHQPVDIALMNNIINESSRDLKIPFEGKPLKGIQIMGVLEARGLNFDTVIIADVNEGTLPQKNKIDPLLPEIIKKDLGLYSYKDREDLVKYYFFRLVYSSNNAIIAYKTGTTSDEKNVRSRFIEQLILINELKNKKVSLSKYFSKPPIIKGIGEGIEKDKDAIEHFDKVFNSTEPRDYLSASYIDIYLNCPYKYYLKRIKNVEPIKGFDEDYEADTVGIIVHSLLEEVFKEKTSIGLKEVDEIKNDMINKIENLTRDYTVGKTREAMERVSKYLKSLSDFQFDAFKMILNHRMKNFFAFAMEDIKKHGKFKVLNTEKTIINNKLKLKGVIDRLDVLESEHTIRIVDYKTGSYAKAPLKRGINDLELNLDKFDKNTLEKVRNILRSSQLPIYIKLVREGLSKSRYKDYHIDACLILLSQPTKNMVVSIEENEVYFTLVEYILNHMKNSKQIFALPGDNCKYCEFKYLCKFSI